MSLIGRLLGTERESETVPDDARAIARYRHLVTSAPAESLEQAHVDAFGRLSEEQRAALYEELSRGAGTGERPLSSEPATLARSATRAERRVPGSMERTLTAAGVRDPVVDGVTQSTLLSAFLPWNG